MGVSRGPEARFPAAFAGNVRSWTIVVSTWAKDEIRLGWQLPWATQGQIVMGLKKTNVQELTGQRLTFIPYS